MNTAHIHDLHEALAGCRFLDDLNEVASLPGREFWGADHEQAWFAKKREILAGQHESDTGEVMDDLPWDAPGFMEECDVPENDYVKPDGQFGVGA